MQGTVFFYFNAFCQERLTVRRYSKYSKFLRCIISNETVMSERWRSSEEIEARRVQQRWLILAVNLTRSMRRALRSLSTALPTVYV
jgi:hypothetical protein